VNSFSFFDRDLLKANLKSSPPDLLVIGGGITGAGIALDAATRGIRVGLVEKHDFAFGTSSRSTKLIHGGLRYLKQLEFALVKEVGSERAVVHRLAPYLVIPEKMLLPLSEGKSMGYWLTSLGLKVYDILAGVTDEDKRRMLSRPETLRTEPLLKAQGIKGGALYAEYRTDDARLTTEILKAAARHGAVLLNYSSVVGFEKKEGKITGAVVRDERSGEEYVVPTNVVVNASGPWVDDIRTTDGSKQGSTLHLTKGVHIVVPLHKLPIRQSIYFEVSDGRMVFAIPRGQVTYIGTTDTDYVGKQEQVRAERADVEYLVQAVNENFTITPLSTSDVIATWAGLRPLIHEDGKSASELSRKDEIFVSDSGLISIAGGKLTGYRKMAERVVDQVIETFFLDRILGDCVTDRVLLGHHFSGYKDFLQFRKQVGDRSGSDAELQGQLFRLADTYGPACMEIINAAAGNGLTSDSLLESEIVFSIRNEMVTGLSDFFVRRTGMLYFDPAGLEKMLPSAKRIFSRLLNWSTDEISSQERIVRSEMDDACQF